MNMKRQTATTKSHEGSRHETQLWLDGGGARRGRRLAARYARGEIEREEFQRKKLEVS